MQSVLGALKCVHHKIEQCIIPIKCARTRCTPLQCPSWYQVLPLICKAVQSVLGVLKCVCRFLIRFPHLPIRTPSTHSVCSANRISNVTPIPCSVSRFLKCLISTFFCVFSKYFAIFLACVALVALHFITFPIFFSLVKFIYFISTFAT